MTSGQIVTCYSYKGGVGRSFALANMAALLAQWRLRVLCIDWDLEAPGLNYYFGVDGLDRPGLLEMVEAVAEGEHVDPLAHVVAAPVGSAATVDLISAGRADASYVGRVQALDWEGLYADHDLGTALEDWRNTWKRKYDVVLVDSRTGVTDIGGICTAQLPDILMLFFTANRQGVEGVLKVRDQAIAARNRLPFDRAGLLTVPVPSRIDQGVEYERAENWRQIFRRSFEHCYQDWALQGADLSTLMGHMTIPYSAYWSFGEELPVLVENQRDATYVSYTLATLAALLVHRLEKTDVLEASRDSFVDAAARLAGHREGFAFDVFISATRETGEEAAALVRLLDTAGLKVAPMKDLGPGSSWDADIERTLDESQHVVVLLSDKTDSFQQREFGYVLRQSLDDRAERRVIPVLTTMQARKNMSSLLRNLQYYDLTRGSLREAAAVVGQAVVDSRGAEGFG
ncbi:KGGVGR-motif variant AAA ATPase [Kribbella sp. NPDC055110]